jgi:hypothetical protein
MCTFCLALLAFQNAIQSAFLVCRFLVSETSFGGNYFKHFMSTRGSWNLQQQQRHWQCEFNDSLHKEPLA